MMRKTLPNIHQGEVLLEEFLKPMDIREPFDEQFALA
jgi:hypothetical protein